MVGRCSSSTIDKIGLQQWQLEEYVNWCHRSNDVYPPSILVVSISGDWKNTSIGAKGHSIFVLGSLLTTAIQFRVCPLQSHRIVSALLNTLIAKPF